MITKLFEIGSIWVAGQPMWPSHHPYTREIPGKEQQRRESRGGGMLSSNQSWGGQR